MTIPLHLQIAMGELGVEEWPGDENNPRILKYLNATPVGRWSPYDRTSWCGAYQAWTYVEAGEEDCIPHNAHRARAWLRFKDKLEEPELGCSTVLKYKRGSNQRTGSWGGYHVGKFMDVTRGGIIVLSGNTQDRVGIDFFSRRKWDVLAYRG